MGVMKYKNTDTDGGRWTSGGIGADIEILYV